MQITRRQYERRLELHNQQMYSELVLWGGINGLFVGITTGVWDNEDCLGEKEIRTTPLHKT